MRAFFLVLAFCLSACGAPPPSSTSVAFEVRDGWAPPTPGGVDVSAGYLTILNGTNQDEQILSVSSPRAERVELHEMTMEGSVMHMQKADRLSIPAHGRLILAPSGRHLMFFGVTQPFVEGDHIPVTLTFAHVGEVTTLLTVERGGQHTH